MNYLFLILFLLASLWRVPSENAWAFRQVLGLGILSFIISTLLTKKYHVSVGLCFLVTMLFGLIQQGVPQFGSEVVTSMMALLIFACLGLGLSEDIFENIIPAMSLVATIDAVIIIYRSISHFGQTWGHMKAWWVMTNGSLDACFLAMMLILSVLSGSKIRSGLMLIAILLSKSNTAIFSLILMAMAYFGSKRDWKKFCLISFAGIASTTLTRKILGIKFLDDSGRFNNWKLMLGFWKDHINHYLGAGPGTYWVYSQWIQGHKAGDSVFSWMHNDWLQVLFEQGFVGLGCIIFLYSMMLWKSFDEPILFALVIGYGFIACTLYPLHLFMFQLIGTALIFACFKKEPIHIEVTLGEIS